MDDGPQYLTSVIGMTCNQVCRSVGTFYDGLNVPVVSIGCNADVLSRGEDDESYHSFARVVTSWTTLVNITTALLQEYGWNRVAVVAETDLDSLGFATALHYALNEGEVLVDMNYTVSSESVHGFVENKMRAFVDCKVAMEALGSESNNTMNSKQPMLRMLVQICFVASCFPVKTDEGA